MDVRVLDGCNKHSESVAIFTFDVRACVDCGVKQFEVSSGESLESQIGHVKLVEVCYQVVICANGRLQIPWLA